MNTVHRARVETFIAARAQFGNDHHINAVVEYRSQRPGTSPEARITVDAFVHINSVRGVGPNRVAPAGFDTSLAASFAGKGIGSHGRQGSWQ